MGARIVILILLLGPFGVYADSRLDDYPGLELVDKVIGKADGIHKIILGSLKKINNVKPEYKKKIFKACLKTSELSKDIKFVKVFLKFTSYISIKKIIEKRK